MTANGVQNLEEGLMVKDLTSPYVVGEKSRSRQHWIKMKADYSDQTTNLDVLVLGAYWASGRARGGRFSSFLLGVQADEKERAEEEGFMAVDEEEGQRSVLSGRRFYTLGRTGSGFTTKDLEELHRYVDERGGWKRWQVSVYLNVLVIEPVEEVLHNHRSFMNTTSSIYASCTLRAIICSSICNGRLIRPASCPST